MKKFILPVIIAITVLACTQNNKVTVSGKIANPLSENVVIQVGEENDTIALSENNSFSTEISIDKERLAYFRNGNLRISMYLIPGTNINLNFDVEDFKNDTASESIFSGSGTEPTAFMFSLKDKSIKEGIQALIQMPVDSFQTKMDNAYAAIKAEIENFKNEKNPSAEFITTLSLIQDIDFAQKYLYYIQYHSRFVPNDTIPIPDSFQEFVDNIPIGEYEKHKDIQEFKSFTLMSYQMNLSKELEADPGLKRGTVAYTEKNADLLAALDIPVDLKDQLGMSFLTSYSYSPDSIQEVYKARYKELIQNQEYIDEFEETVATIEKTKPGSVAPAFNYADINGTMVSSESLKGKVIYIDVWATWCGPCRGEIPSLKKMETEIHGEPIAFVSISIDDDKAAWEKMVKEEELQGYQLFAEGAWDSDIANSYAIKGIPRFIMVDKEGKIVNANATRPSNPATKEKLLELAKK